MNHTSPVPRWTPSHTARSVQYAARMYTSLLRLCPQALREEYSAEMAQVFRQLAGDAWAERGAWGALTCFTSALSDLLAGALAEYLALIEGAYRRSWMMNRMRASAILVFCAYIVFVVLGMGFQKSTEDVVKSNVPSLHPGIALAYDAVIAGAVIALLATLAGGLPIAFAALRQAVTRRRWGVVALFAVPPISLAVWAGWTWMLLNVIFPARHVAAPTTTTDHLYIYSWIAVFIAAAIASVAAVSVAIVRSDLPPQLFRFALTPEIGVALGMLVAVLAVVAWGAQMLSFAPKYLAGPDGPVGLNAPLGAHIIADIVLMGLATLIVFVGIARGFSARRALAA